MFQNQLVARSPSFRGSLKALEADIHHANTLADSIQRAYGGACLQMRLSYSPMAPFFLFLMQWLDCTCSYTLPGYLGLLQILISKAYSDGSTRISTYERRASLREFYAVIYPSLQQIESNLVEKEDWNGRGRCEEIIGRKRVEERRKLSDKDVDREDECGICMEVCTKMVLPNCNHAMCINCYHDWYNFGIGFVNFGLVRDLLSWYSLYSFAYYRNTRSQSCPFCRGSLKRVRSRDLWVLVGTGDAVDSSTLVKENLRRFYLFIDKLPLTVPDTLFLVYYDYLV